jgi:hypothetical protein
MKRSVLQRKMFMKPPVKKAEGGILSLVEEGMGMEGEDDNYKDRRPDNIEIIANNLRGDIRSMDERYLELAQMVGESAFDTPEEVLALMQPQMAQQMAQQTMPPAANSPSPQGMQQISQGASQGAPQGAPSPGAPGMPMPPEQPQGIAALGAPEAPAQAPQPMAQAPVQRAAGSPPTGEFKTGQGLQIDITGVGSEPIRAYQASPRIDFGDTGTVKLDAMPETDFGTGIAGELDEYFEAGGDENTLLSALMNTGEGEKKDSGIASLSKKKGDYSDMLAMGARGLQMAGYGRSAEDEAKRAFAEQMELQKLASPWVRNRAAGSPPMGEEPYLSDVARNIPITDGAEPRLGGQGIRVPGAYPADDIYRSGEGMAKSRPLTYEELVERVRERENRTMGPRTRKFYEALRGMGIEPELFAPKIKKALDTVKSLPGMGKVGKVLGKIGPADAGIAVSGGALGYELLKGDDKPAPAPGPGVVPTLPNLPDGSPSAANQIPPMAGSPLGLEGGPPTEIPSVELRREEPVNPPVVEVDLTKPQEEPEPYREDAYTGDNVPPGDQIDTPSPADLTKKKGESDEDFRARVRARANIYKDLLGEDEESRKAKAYFLLAEAGLALAGAKGRNIGERISVGLKGLPSGFAKLASEKTQIDRAATSAAISAIEQQDRDEAKNLAAVKTALIRSMAKGPTDRDNKIASLTQVFQAGHNMPEEQAKQMAKLKVDGALVNDELGNERIGNANGQIVAYGPANQPINPENPAFIDPTYPFQVQNPSRPTPAMEPKQMSKLVEENEKLTSMLGQLQRAKTQLAGKIGPLNVLQRGLSKATVPWIGDLGPLTADEASTFAIDDLNKIIRGYKSVNADGGRVSNWEMQNNQSLEINTGSFFTAPAIELRKIIAMETEMINQIQKNKFRLNPRDGENVYRQMAVPPSGSKNDPIPANAFSTLGQYFSTMPGTTVYMKYALPDGKTKTVGITKQYYDQEMARQQQQRKPTAQ